MNLEKLLETLINAVPEMVALIVVVRMFIMAQREERKAFGELLKDIGTACHDFQKEVIKDTTQALEKTTTALHENTRTLGRAEQFLKVIRANGQ